jgi:hypothetical protein
MVMEIKPAESHIKVNKGAIGRIWVWVLLLIILTIVMTPQLFALVFTVSICALPIILLIAASGRTDNSTLLSGFWHVDEARFRIREILIQAERERLAQMVERQPSGSAMPLYGLMYRVGGWLVHRGSALQKHYGRLLGRPDADSAAQQKHRSAW